MIYDNVKRCCNQKGLSIRELEIRAGLGNGTIGGWKTGNPRTDILLKVADVLEVSLDDLTRKGSKSCH